MRRRELAHKAIIKTRRARMLVAIKTNVRDDVASSFIPDSPPEPKENVNYSDTRNGTEQDLYEYLTRGEIKRDVTIREKVFFEPAISKRINAALESDHAHEYGSFGCCLICARSMYESPLTSKRGKLKDV